MSSELPPETPTPKSALSTIKDAVYIHTLPSYGNKIFYGLGFLLLSSLLLLAISGAIMIFMGSSWWLLNPVGVYVRSVHLWSVQAFIALLLLHGLVGFSTSAFKSPRSLTWVLGATIFCLAIFQTEFGYGLRGDFSSQFRAVSGADFWNGSYLGYWINPLSNLQELALHTMIIPFSILAIFILHFILIKSYGIARPYRKDINVRMVPADHRIMFIRGGVLAVAIFTLAFFFHSPYVPALTIADTARTNPTLVADTLQQEFDHTSDTATYFDSIDPYRFDTRDVFVIKPYMALVGIAATSSTTSMVTALMPWVTSGAYQSFVNSEDPEPSTYVLRFLNDMGVLEEKAGTLGFSTEQWGMARDENGGFTLPPGSWWLAPLGFLNSAFNLLDNPHGDRIAAETFGALMLLLITFPYIPYLNRIPEFLGIAPLIWKEPKEKQEKH